MSIASKLAEIRERIARAAQQAGREPGEVALMAVSKTHPGRDSGGDCRPGKCSSAKTGCRSLPPSATRCWPAPGGEVPPDRPFAIEQSGARGELFDAIDSVDSLRLAERLNEAAARLNRKLDVLIEINIGGEAAKSGLDPGSAELLTLFDAQVRLANLAIRGCMTVPPFTEIRSARAAASASFANCRLLKCHSGLPLTELSMGMSHDFEVAIEEGSTCVRVGTAIFGERSYSSRTRSLHDEMAGCTVCLAAGVA